MKKLNLVICLMAMAMVFWQCSSDEIESSNIEGTATKGIVANGNVTVYAVSDDGGRGDALGSTTTDANGNFSLEFEHRGVVEVVVSGGSYKDEASGQNVSVDELRSMVEVDGNEQVGVTALTTIAASYVNENADEGLSIAIENATSGVANAFGLAGVDISSTTAADLSAHANSTESAEEKKYGAVQAGISQLVHENGLSAEAVLDIIEDMENDYKDGVFDGKSGEAAVQFSTEITSEQALAGLEVAINTFLSSDSNISGFVDFN